MAPTKRKNTDTVSSDNHTTISRVTRSSTRQATKLTPKPAAEPVTKKPKPTPKKTKKPEPKADKLATEISPPLVDEVDNGSKTIVVEHCKQCNQFKVRAVKVKTDLEKAVSGINVVVNPEKPRRGCFEVREEGGKKFVSLLDMKRPFAPMKALDMDAVISDIIDQIK